MTHGRDLDGNPDDEIIGTLVGLFGSRFGGVWIDHEGPEDAICLAVVEPTEGDQRQAVEVASQSGWPARIKPVRYSQSDLEGFLADVGRVMEEVPSDAWLSFGTRPDRNRVEVELNREDDRIIDRLKSLLPSDALDIQVTPGARFEPLPRRTL